MVLLAHGHHVRESPLAGLHQEPCLSRGLVCVCSLGDHQNDWKFPRPFSDQWTKNLLFGSGTFLGQSFEYLN